MNRRQKSHAVTSTFIRDNHSIVITLLHAYIYILIKYPNYKWIMFIRN